MRISTLTTLTFLFLLLQNVKLFPQNDSIVFNNGNYIVGELKDLGQGIIHVKLIIVTVILLLNGIKSNS